MYRTYVTHIPFLDLKIPSTQLKNWVPELIAIAFSKEVKYICKDLLN